MQKPDCLRHASRGDFLNNFGRIRRDASRVASPFSEAETIFLTKKELASNIFTVRLPTNYKPTPTDVTNLEILNTVINGLHIIRIIFATDLSDLSPEFSDDHSDQNSPSSGLSYKKLLRKDLTLMERITRDLSEITGGNKTLKELERRPEEDVNDLIYARIKQDFPGETKDFWTEKFIKLLEAYENSKARDDEKLTQKMKSLTEDIYRRFKKEIHTRNIFIIDPNTLQDVADGLALEPHDVRNRLTPLSGFADIDANGIGLRAQRDAIYLLYQTALTDKTAFEQIPLGCQTYIQSLLDMPVENRPDGEKIKETIRSLLVDGDLIQFNSTNAPRTKGTFADILKYLTELIPDIATNFKPEPLNLQELHRLTTERVKTLLTQPELTSLGYKVELKETDPNQEIMVSPMLWKKTIDNVIRNSLSAMGYIDKDGSLREIKIKSKKIKPFIRVTITFDETKNPSAIATFTNNHGQPIPDHIILRNFQLGGKGGGYTSEAPSTSVGMFTLRQKIQRRGGTVTPQNDHEYYRYKPDAEDDLTTSERDQTLEIDVAKIHIGLPTKDQYEKWIKGNASMQTVNLRDIIENLSY